MIKFIKSLFGIGTEESQTTKLSDVVANKETQKVESVQKSEAPKKAAPKKAAPAKKAPAKKPATKKAPAKRGRPSKKKAD